MGRRSRQRRDSWRAVVIICVDGRFQPPLNAWLDGLQLRRGKCFDRVTAIGPPIVMERLEDYPDILHQVGFCLDKHQMNEIWLAAHEDCAGLKHHGHPCADLAVKHKQYQKLLRRARSKLWELFPGVRVRFVAVDRHKVRPAKRAKSKPQGSSRVEAT